MAAFAALCFSLTAQAQGPVVVSDKDDYSPGETAMFSAAGFQPGEMLDFSVAISDENGEWVPDIAWADVPADASGGAEVDYVVPQTWANKTLQLTVMGLSSQGVATTTFTDAPKPDTTSVINLSSNNVVAGTMVTVTATVTSTSAVNCGDLRIEISTDGGTTFDTWMHEDPTDGTLSAMFNTSGLGGQSFKFRTHYVAGSCDFQGSTSIPQTGVMLTITNPATNHAPQIECLDPTAQLGAKNGCLVDGILQASFGVTYSVVDGAGNSKVVQATFSTPNGDVTADVANVTDADPGDTISVMPPSGTNPVIISGPGNGSASFSVDIQASDGTDTVNSTCGGEADAQITYAVFNGFFSPLNNNTATKVKRGSGVPVKFQLKDDCDNLITTGDHTISVAWHCGVSPEGPADVDDAGASNGDTAPWLFRWDPTGMQWIFNLKTNTSYAVGATYKITATLDDGTSRDVYISIK